MWNMKIGGAERAVYQLIRAQAMAGQQCGVLICNDSGYYGDQVKKCGTDVFSLGMKRATDLSVGKTFKAILGQFDVAHFHSCEPYLMHLASAVKKTRLFYTHRGGVFKYKFAKALRYRFCGRVIRRHFAGISGNTTEGAKAASSLFKIPLSRIKTTYNGLDFSLLQPAVTKEHVLNEMGISRRNRILIGSSAVFKSWKRLDYLISSAAALPRDKFLCVLIGDGPDRPRLEQLTRKLNMQANTIFVGKKTNTADYLQVIDIFVLPSGSHESFGNSAVEAMAMGIPTIVMRDGGGLVEHIANGTTGYIAEDCNDLTTKLELLIGNPGLRKNVGIAGKVYVTGKYTVSQMLDAYNCLYKGQQT
jgi:glycosyltransferase involved in cell wall biosynthesis